MTYPTAEQLTNWAHTLTTTNWTKLATRLNTAIERDRRGGSAIPDGYPCGSNQGGGTSELTPTEAAAHARSTARDEHHDRTTTAVSYLEQAVQSLGALVTQLDRIEARTIHAEGREPGCTHHAQYGLHEERFRGDTCRPCYQFKAEYGCLPPFKLLDDRARGIRWTTATINRALAEAGVRR